MEQDLDLKDASDISGLASEDIRAGGQGACDGGTNEMVKKIDKEMGEDMGGELNQEETTM